MCLLCLYSNKCGSETLGILIIEGLRYKQRFVIKSVSGSPVAYMINRKISGRGSKEHAACGEGSRRPTAQALDASRPASRGIP